LVRGRLRVLSPSARPPPMLPESAAQDAEVPVFNNGGIAARECDEEALPMGLLHDNITQL
jgi:hypothetical protein